MFRPDADPAFAQKVAYDMSLEPPEVALPAMESLWHMDYAQVLPDIKVPIVAINSDQFPTDEARIRKVVPDFKVVTVEHTGHSQMKEAPDRFNPGG